MSRLIPGSERPMYRRNLSGALSVPICRATGHPTVQRGTCAESRGSCPWTPSGACGVETSLSW
eukprot:6621148-Alexandrium_andersonii.AAC.1